MSMPGFNFGQTTSSGTPQTSGFASLANTTTASGFGVSSKSSTLSLSGKPLGQSTGPTTTVGTLSTATNTTSSTAASQNINYGQLEEQINKWNLELEDQEKIFIQQATQVNAWDRLLVDNGEKIAQLNTDVEKVKLDQQHLDQELDFISAQQKELEELLLPLEQAVEQIPPIHRQQHADLEREHTYKLAENMDAQLKRMVQDLKEIIDHINSSNSVHDGNDPVQQVAKVLNAHMDSLQWIDQNTALLQARVDEVAKVSEQRKKQQEKNFRLAYD